MHNKSEVLAPRVEGPQASQINGVDSSEGLGGVTQSRRVAETVSSVGVDWKKNVGKWRARISINNKRAELGYYDTQAEACAAYAGALQQAALLRVTKVRAKSDPSVRFASKVIAQPNGCVLWQGAKDKDGYGKFQLNGGGRQQHVCAHRYAYFLKHGVWPAQLILHSCDTPACVNPDHMEDGDQAKNVRDCVARGRHRPGKAGRRKTA